MVLLIPPQSPPLLETSKCAFSGFHTPTGRVSGTGHGSSSSNCVSLDAIYQVPAYDNGMVRVYGPLGS